LYILKVVNIDVPSNFMMSKNYVLQVPIIVHLSKPRSPVIFPVTSPSSLVKSQIVSTRFFASDVDTIMKFGHKDELANEIR